MSVRDRILEAALVELRERDESEFRVTGVARAAGCATSVLYHHFGSRRGLIDAALQRAVTEEAAERRTLYEAMAEVIARADTAEGAIEELAGALGAEDRRAQRTMRWRLVGLAATRPSLAGAMSQFEAQRQSQFEAVARLAQERSLLRSDLEPAALAAVFSLLEERGASPGLVRALCEGLAPPAQWDRAD